MGNGRIGYVDGPIAKLGDTAAQKCCVDFTSKPIRPRFFTIFGMANEDITKVTAINKGVTFHDVGTKILRHPSPSQCQGTRNRCFKTARNALFPDVVSFALLKKLHRFILSLALYEGSPRRLLSPRENNP